MTLEEAENFLFCYEDSIESGLSHDGWERISFYLEDMFTRKEANA